MEKSNLALGFRGSPSLGFEPRLHFDMQLETESEADGPASLSWRPFDTPQLAIDMDREV